MTGSVSEPSRPGPLRRAVRWARGRRDWLRLPREARLEAGRDRAHGLLEDPGPAWTLEAAADWLCRAQDRSASGDGGVARHYSLISGWGPSYPEVTGYIVPTFFRLAEEWGDPDLEDRARRMLEWLVSHQFPDGAFPGGVIGARPWVPVIFNTGQVLLGLAEGVRRDGTCYRGPLRAAADWLALKQAPGGSWRTDHTPFARAGLKTFHTQVASALFEADRVDPGRGYGEAGLRNVRWALSHQRENGWFDHCCLSDPGAPLTHTLGYALWGVLEGYRFSGDRAILEAARRTGEGLMGALDERGGLPGRLDAEWRGATASVCLTGNVQGALCWSRLYEATRERPFLEAARAATRFVRRTLPTEAPDDRLGGVKASFPVDGAYCPFEYVSWAAKYTIDALLEETRVTAPPPPR